MEILNTLLNNAQNILAAIVLILSGAITISLIIPGEQPEKALQSLADFLSRFSRKK